MLRLSALALAAAFTIFCAAPAAWAIVDNGPPYTSEQFIALSNERIPESFKKQLPAWWARAPEYLKRRILTAPSYMWWPIILCNYMGYKPGAGPALDPEKCEQDAYKGTQRGKSMWTSDGRWVGPSEECRKRDKRTQWGELICD